MAFSAAITGMMAQEQKIKVISHNIANANTTSFKEDIISFHDIGYQHRARVGSVFSDSGDTLPAGVRFGFGVAVSSVSKNFKQGLLSPSESEYSIAIDGPGFYQVLMPNGDPGYTRDGNLQLNADRQLTNNTGFVIQPPITIPDDALNMTITPDGRVQISRPSQTDLEEVGVIELSRFNLEQLTPVGNNIYTIPSGGETTLQGAPSTDGLGKILQFFLEEANPSIITQLSDLIVAQRGYEANGQSMKAEDHILKVTLEA